MKKTYVQRNYKDTVFRMLFKEKENLLSLYNALNGTVYTDVDRQEITTLENAVYMNYKNDISFVFDFQPKQQVLRLSDAFEKQQERPELELIVTVYNINWGQNPELMEACRLLKEYAKYVEQVRNYAKEMPFPEAVEHAVDACIKEGVLAEFLSKNRAEAIAMSIFEYDEEKHIKSEREWAYKNGHEDGHRKGLEEGHREGREEGRREGEKAGLKKGEQRLAQLLQSLMDKGQGAEVNRVLSDSAYREQLYLEHNL